MSGPGLPRTKAGKRLLHDMGFTTRTWSERAERLNAAIMAIEDEVQPTAPAEGLDVERLATALVKVLGPLHYWTVRDTDEMQDAIAIAREYAALTPEDDRPDFSTRIYKENRDD